MAKNRTQYVCQACGAHYPRWHGQCEQCGAWNTLVEERMVVGQATPGKASAASRALQFTSLTTQTALLPRIMTGIREWDRVCGGGIVAGAAMLIGGDPGIGKSTLLLQLAAMLSTQGDCLYITGEESVEQVRQRAARLGVAGKPLQLASSSSLEDVLASVQATPAVKLLVIDSIQTIASDQLDSAPGTVGQVRHCAHQLVMLAKQRGFALVLVGHVTKEGAIAGPRVLEHMVDTVLYFEGDRSHQFRILRTVKNRFGATDEIGVFAMEGSGLQEVANPSALFLTERDQAVSGAVVFAGMEGTRPLLVEIQALVAPSPIAMPRRTAVGWDSNRLNMILAVLEARCRLSFANKDVYLNVAGGLRLSEPAADLAVSAALVSALANVPAPRGAVFFGEIALSGEVRPVAHAAARLREAHKLGFSEAYTPAQTAKIVEDGVQVTELARASSLVRLMADKAREAA